MDTGELGGFDIDRSTIDDVVEHGGVQDEGFQLSGDERRMQVRAYNHWVSLLHGRPYPTIIDLDPANIADFGPHSVLIDFGAGADDPVIAYLGRELREECALDSDITRINDVPARSLLSRLTDHYLQIIANRAPVGFEAEFVGTRGRTTLYRGILMPFSSDGDEIDFIYGVINWKELVDADTQASLSAELDAAMRAAPTPNHSAPVWADGPSGGFDETKVGDEDEPAESLPAVAHTLGERLMLARESAAQVRAADSRGRAALYRALGRAHDFALAAAADADGYAELLAASAIKVQPRAPMTPIVKLIFGADYDKTRLAEYATVLGHAQRHTIPAGELAATLERFEGGVKAVVAAERAARRPAPAKLDRYDLAAAELRALPVLANLPIGAGKAEFVVLLARAGADGTLDIVSRIDDDSVVQKLMKRAA
ncbi:hypothetical protein GGQ80_003388 [Sphingomonas jinjuensis]|uniref:Uncharacterized protein n=1 Tax=Sphingomonas jinjuensis TaxID=535907 RepID=A0A840FQB7_9SPHN|nr:hypothetical protein [Sphingomonas jinjuensis]MBB4155465.1 hypothetical protein [Sphingomonas jinjuensis]